MRIRGVASRAAVLALVALAAPGAARAQSLFGSRGLGLPASPSDARVAALGGLAVAFPDVAPSFVNPALVSGAVRRGVIAAMQPTFTDVQVDGGSDNVEATRFPAIEAFLPVGGRTVIAIGFGSFLDQNWGTRESVTEPLGADTVDAVDVITSRGGIGQARATIGYSPSERVSFGVSGGLLTGSRIRRAQRTFESPTVPLQGYVSQTRVSYVAPALSAGAVWDPVDLLSVGASVSWYGTLKQTSDDLGDRDIAMPLQLSIGANGQLAPDLTAIASARWSGWSAADADLSVEARDTWELGGGLEYTGISGVKRSFPLRLGARWSQVPFAFDGVAPTEWALTGGLGARLAGTEEAPAAMVNAALERGQRGSLEENGLHENFWRATISLSLFGL